MCKIPNFSLVALLALFFFPVLSSYGQHIPDKAIDDLIENHNYSDAEKLVDQGLAKNPKWVDGWMYKGNLVIYQGCLSTGMYVGANPDDSVYEDSIGVISDAPEPDQCSKETAMAAVSYFQKALNIEPKRKDIELGACWILSKAGLVDLLNARLKTVNKKFPSKDLPFTLMDYVRNTGLSVGYDSAKEVFEALHSLYPDLGDLDGDFAAFALSHQRQKDVLFFANKALVCVHSDADTAKNLVLDAGILGDYDLGLRAAKRYSILAKNHYGLMYQGFVKRLNDDPTWKKDLENYVRLESSETEEKAVVQAYLAVKDNSAEDYYKAVKGFKDTGLFIVSIQWIVHQYPDQFDAVNDLANAFGQLESYPQAIALYQKIEAMKNLDPKQLSKCLMFHAWALQATGEKEEADKIWSRLIDDKDLYVKSAACWFLGKNTLDKGNKSKALALFSRVSGHASEDKYANYCLNAENRLEGKGQ